MAIARARPRKNFSRKKRAKEMRLIGFFEQKFRDIFYPLRYIAYKHSMYIVW